MDAAVHAEHVEHSHPTWQTYTKIALVLFVLTALEVWSYDIVHRHSPAGLATLLEPVVTEVLLILSAIKFALVAMFYMHLKFDHRLFSWLFVVPMVIATFVILALMKLFGRW